MALILLKYWKYFAAIIILSIAGYFIYNKIYTIGFNDANVACATRMQEYSDNLEKRMSALVATSNQLALATIDNRASLKKDFSAILSNIKGKPLYTIEQGECKPSNDYISTYNEAVKRANKND